MQRTKYSPKDFLWTKWTVTDIKKLPSKVLSEKKSLLNTVKKIQPAKRTFENTIYAIESSNHNLTEVAQKIHLIHSASPDKKIRDEAKRAAQTIEKNMITITHDPLVWEALKDYKQSAWKNEQKKLDGPSKKLFLDLYRGYQRMGFDLSPKKQKRLNMLEQELSKVSSEFRSNINAYKDHIIVSEKEADGLSTRYKQGLKRDKNGDYIVTLAYPDYDPFMQLAHNEQKRKELAEKFLRRGGKKNLEILKKMLRLRSERASLLGYKNHADYRTELRMAKSGAAAFKFVSDLIKKVEAGGKKDIADLRSLKRELTGNKNAKLHFYDIAHYAHKLQKHRFNFDSEEVREYFPLERVLDGTFKIYGKLFGVSFKKLSGFPLWHPDVSLYAIRNNKKVTIAYFALDLYPREGKYGHAAAFELVGGRCQQYGNATYIAPLAAMVTNFTKPSREHPSLLSHGEVDTFLHEFGHIMHHTLTSADYLSQSGFNTSWDFVEAPSQMLEHWAWNEKSVALLSSHYKTRKPLPKELLKNLIASKKHLQRYQTLRQLILGMFDLSLHLQKKAPDPNKAYRALFKKYTGFNLSPRTMYPAGFGHLDGYDAGYYGYMWSNVYASDMFTRFEKEGILNAKTGADYKKWILEKGGSQDELDLVRGFLGRKPSNEAFLKEIGIRK